jgi:Tfp pilus assembly protein PilF
VGTVKSGVFSPLLKAPVAMAYLAREYRVPGKVLEFVADRTTYTATVTWLPFYTASGVTERAKAKYDEALQLFAQDQDEQAIVLLRAAIELDPHLADAYEALGVILSRHEEYEEAISLMHKLAEIDPESVMAHTNLSMFYMKQGMKEEAEAEKEKATLLGFKKAMAERQSLKSEEEQRLQRQQALEDKVQMFQEVLALDAEDALANYGLGNTFLELGRNQEAAPLLEKAVQMDPKYTVAYLALGKVYEALKNVDQARQTYEKGIEVAAQRGDLMPLQEMQRRLAAL